MLLPQLQRIPSSHAERQPGGRNSCNDSGTADAAVPRETGVSVASEWGTEIGAGSSESSRENLRVAGTYLQRTCWWGSSSGCVHALIFTASRWPPSIQRISSTSPALVFSGSGTFTASNILWGSTDQI